METLKRYHKNPRQITEKQYHQLEEWLRELGDLSGIVHDLNSDEIIGGNQRSRVFDIDKCKVELSQQFDKPDEQGTVGLGFVIWEGKKYAYRQARWDDKQCEKANIVANKAGGSFDFDVLANEFELDDLLEWGFDAKELDLDMWDKDEPPDDPGAQIDKAEELREKWGVESGQLWQLGEHRLICGDCTDRVVVERVMMGEMADLCLTDPPYGLGDKKTSGKNDYDQHDDTKENLIKLAGGWLPIARELCPTVVFSPGVTNAWLYPEADWIMCWFYGGGQSRSSWGFNCWQPFLCYGKDPSLAHGHGCRPDAIDMNTSANAKDIDHPCPKPLKLWQWFIERLSFKMGEIFYEPFCGSGTTLIVCEQNNRKCRAVEISPAYCAVAIQRWVDMTGGEPVLLENVTQ